MEHADVPEDHQSPRCEFLAHLEAVEHKETELTVQSNNFQFVDWANLEFPNYLRIDYVRVYQRNDGSGTLGCDPEDYPTKDYIERHIDVYSDPNITTWSPGMSPFSLPSSGVTSSGC